MNTEMKRKLPVEELQERSRCSYLAKKHWWDRVTKHTAMYHACLCVSLRVCVHGPGTQASQLPAVAGLFMCLSLPRRVLHVCAYPEEPLPHRVQFLSDLLESIPVLAANL